MMKNRRLYLVAVLFLCVTSFAMASELPMGTKLELESLYSSFLSGADLGETQLHLLQEHGFLPSEGDPGIDREGGPDNTGYIFIDNEEDNGPEYDWIDITETGTVVTGILDDNHVGPFDIDFDFPFYGVEYNQFWIQSNGVISFFGTYVSLTNLSMPTTTYGAMIAWFWDDLNPSGGNGTVYYQNMTHNNHDVLVLTYENYREFGNTGRVTAQVQLYDNGAIYILYDALTDGIDITSCTIGIQGDGENGLEYLYNNTPAGYPYEDLALMFTNGQGVISGTVTDDATDDPIEDAEVILWTEDQEFQLESTFTNSDGEYEFTNLQTGIYEVQVVATGYIGQVATDLEIVDIDDQITQDFALLEQTETVIISGTVFSADTPDTPVEGITVELLDLELTEVTDENGAFSFGEQLEGDYDFQISYNPVGSNGYHDVLYQNVQVIPTTVPLEFFAYEILAPQNFEAGLGDGFILLQWDAPVNHMDIVALQERIESRQLYIETLAEINTAKTQELLAEYRAELFMLENELARRQRDLENEPSGSELDELDDFTGYRILLDGEVMDVLVPPGQTSYTVTGLESNQVYSFAVAADYDYGAEYLVWTEELDIEYTILEYFYFELDEFMWEEIHPDDGGEGIGCNLSDDGYTQLIPFPNGQSFEFFGLPYESFEISANGVISFIYQYITYTNTSIPNSSSPNLILCPFWEDLYPPAGNQYDAFYLIDEELNRVIIEWYTPLLSNTSNALRFEVILYLEEDYFIVNYHSAAQTWETGGTIGVENQSGTRGYSYPNPASDQLSVLWTTGDGILWAVDGTVSDSDGNPIEDALVQLFNDETGTLAYERTTDEDGEYRFSYVWHGMYDLRASKLQYMTEWEEDVEVESDVTVDFVLADETRTVELEGYLMSADSPDTPVPGAIVELPQLDLWVFSDAQGHFTFGEQTIGVYDFYIHHNPIGVTGYHDIFHPSVEIEEESGPIELYVYEILPPQEVALSTGDGFLRVQWLPPANHDLILGLDGWIGRRQEYVESLREWNTERSMELIALFEAEIEMLQQRQAEWMSLLDPSQINETDELEDFVGYRIRLDGTILDNLIAPNVGEYHITGLPSGETYTVEVAADYGYEENYLVWSEPLEHEYYELTFYPIYLEEFIWEELRPDHGGSGTPMNMGNNGYSQLMPFPNGETFSFYGSEYPSFSISANGVVGFVYQYVTPYNVAIPSTASPNLFIAAYWDYMWPAAAAEYDAFYWIDDVNNRVVVQWYMPHQEQQTNPLSYQLILDLENDYYILSYETSESGWYGSMTIGCENGTGTRGVQWDGVVEDELSVLWSPIADPLGTLAGTVINNSTEEPVVNALVQLLDQETGDVLRQTTTDTNGEYEIINIWEGIYDVRCIATFHVTEIIEDVTIAGSETTTLDFALDVETTTTLISGTVVSADTPDTSVEGVTVELVQLGVSEITDANGEFDFGQQLVGIYDIYVSFDPPGSNGYHDITYPQVSVEVGMDPLELAMFEILPVGDFTATAGNHSITLSWTAPTNQLATEVLRQMAHDRRMTINEAVNPTPYEQQKLDALARELFKIENELDRRSGESGLDELDDFAGYLIRLDDQVLPDPVFPTNYVISNVDNGHLYSVSVATDYGYDEEYLNWSEVIDVRPLPDPGYTVIELPQFEWVDIRPSEGGQGTALNMGDDTYSGWIQFPDDWEYTHYGVSYTQFNVSSNGWLSFVSTTGGLSGSIPSTSTPNATIAPYWRDLNVSRGAQYDVWYWFDTDNDRMILQYYAPNYSGGGTDNNPKLFEAILHMEHDYVVFSYHSSLNGWAADASATIGIENAEGTVGTTYDRALLHDELSITFDYIAEFGNIIGTVNDSETDDPVAGATVFLLENPIFSTVSDEDGDYEILLADRGDAPYTLVCQADGYEEAIEFDVEWPGEEFEVVVDFELTTIGPESPPRVVSIDGNYDSGVMVYLAEPGTFETMTLVQDDDNHAADAWFMSPGEQNIIAVPVSHEGAGDLRQVELQFVDPMNTWGVWPDASRDPITVLLYADASGHPGEILFQSDEQVLDDNQTALVLHPDVMITGRFWIGYKVADGNGAEALCIDSNVNGDGILFYTDNNGESWASMILEGDPLVRAYICNNTGTGISNSPIAELQPSTDKNRIHPVSAREQALYYRTLSSIHLPVESFNNPDAAIDELDEFLGYNLYYSLDGETFEQYNDEMIEEDFAYLYLGSDLEDTEFFIYATAMVEDGEVIESNPSITWPALFNMAPSNPTDLDVTVSNPWSNTALLTWDAPTTCADDSALVDLEIYRIYRDGELIDTSDEPTYVDQAPEPGYYSYTVTAMDEVPNESDQSNEEMLYVGPVAYQTDFEEEDTLFVGNGHWQWGTPTINAHSGENVWATNLSGNYTNSDDHWLYFNQSFTVYGPAMLSYFHYTNYESGWDGYNVQVSADSGATWTVLTPEGGYNDATIVGLDNQPGWTQSSGGYQQVLYPLDTYIDETIFFAFRHGTDGSVNSYYGVAIDDLMLMGSVTGPSFGGIEGYVYYCDPDVNEPLAGVGIYLPGMSEPITTSDASGFFHADSVIAGTWDLRFEMDGYWPVIFEGFEIIEDSLITLDPVGMYYPDGETDISTVELIVFIGQDDTDSTGSTDITLLSSGCGPLSWQARLRILDGPGMAEAGSKDRIQLRGYSPPDNSADNNVPEGGSCQLNTGLSGVFRVGNQVVGPARNGGSSPTDELDDVWDYINGFSFTQDPLIYSAVITAENIYALGLQNNTLYRYDHSGNYQMSYELAAELMADDGSGLYDLALDEVSGMLIGGNEDGDIYRFTADMGTVIHLGNTGIVNHAIAYDWENNYIYAMGGDEGFVRLDLYSGETENLARDENLTGVSGIAYMNPEEEGYTLWIMTQGETGGGYAHRYNPETMEFALDNNEIIQENWGLAGGLDISTGWDQNMYNITTVMQTDGNDFVDIWEGLPAPPVWLWIEPTGGWLEPGESTSLSLIADLRDVPFDYDHGDSYDATIDFFGDYWSDPITVLATITIVNSAEDNENLLPTEYALHQNFPNPFNPGTTIRFDLVEAQEVTLTVYNVLGQEVAQPVHGRLEAGYHTVSFVATNLASGVYFYRMEAGPYTKLRKMVLIR